MTPVIFINCTVEPYVDDIMGKLKLYETRTRNTLGRFIGERVLFAETGRGRPLVKCSAVIDQVISVHTREAWEEYLQYTWIPVGSAHDWQPDTKVKWLYHLTDVKPVVPFRLGPDCRRHGRVWAELPDLYNVDYQNTGGGVMCYSAIYKGMYWLFGNEDYINAYNFDPLNDVDEWGNPIDPNGHEIADATEFPTWGEVIDSIPEHLCEFYWIEGREGLRKATTEWQGSLDKRVNEE